MGVLPTEKRKLNRFINIGFILFVGLFFFSFLLGHIHIVRYILLLGYLLADIFVLIGLDQLIKHKERNEGGYLYAIIILFLSLVVFYSFFLSMGGIGI